MNTQTCQESALANMSHKPLDVLIIGGGIVGSGVARDAALRGLRTGLVEQHDFAFGTSSRSSRLLHGGIRYLAQGRIGLVHEASVEKMTLHRIAPHLASSLPFFFPTYRCAPWGPWALWKLAIGVKIYDLLCGGRNLGRSSWFGSSGAAAYLPILNTRNLTGAVRYFDGLTNDARLVIDTLRSAMAAGAMPANYTRFEEAARDGSDWRFTLTHLPSGKTYEGRTRTIVNAAGPWAQKFPQSQIRLRLTKGIHLVIDRERMPIPDAVVITEGTRILFAIPWGERVILGTTDTDYDGVIEDVRSDASDIHYVLDVMNQAFPGIALRDEDVISDWAGLRPLIANPNGTPSDISRAHEIHEPTPGWIDVAGGKLTTYRLMAEQTVDRVARHVDRVIPKSSTLRRPLLPAEETTGISAIIPPEPSKALVEHFCQREWAAHLDDVMIRRSSWRHYFRNAPQIARDAAEWMGDTLGWDAATRKAELARYQTATGTTATV